MERTKKSTITSLIIGGTLVTLGGLGVYALNDELNIPQETKRYYELKEIRETPVYQSELYKNRGSQISLENLDKINEEYGALSIDKIEEGINRREEARGLWILSTYTIGIDLV